MWAAPSRIRTPFPFGALTQWEHPYLPSQLLTQAWLGSSLLGAGRVVTQDGESVTWLQSEGLVVAPGLVTLTS